jgi:hypothetical protein
LKTTVHPSVTERKFSSAQGLSSLNLSSLVAVHLAQVRLQVQDLAAVAPAVTYLLQQQLTQEYILLS